MPDTGDLRLIEVELRRGQCDGLCYVAAKRGVQPSVCIRAAVDLYLADRYAEAVDSTCEEIT